MKKLPACLVETTLRLISDQWTLLIIRELKEGTKRFGELKKNLHPITQKVLTQNLKQMETRGLVIREVFPETPPRVEYTFTDFGFKFQPIVNLMWEYGEGYQKQYAHLIQDSD